MTLLLVQVTGWCHIALIFYWFTIWRLEAVFWDCCWHVYWIGTVNDAVTAAAQLWNCWHIERVTAGADVMQSPTVCCVIFAP